MDGDELIASVYRKIEREKTLMHAAASLRRVSDNPAVQQRADSNIRDGRKNISYLEEKMNELQLRRIEQESGGSPVEGRTSGPPLPPKDGYSANDGGDHEGDPYVSVERRASGPERGQQAGATPKARPNYSKLGVHANFSLLRGFDLEN